MVFSPDCLSPVTHRFRLRLTFATACSCWCLACDAFYFRVLAVSKAFCTASESIPTASSSAFLMCARWLLIAREREHGPHSHTDGAARLCAALYTRVWLSRFFDSTREFGDMYRVVCIKVIAAREFWQIAGSIRGNSCCCYSRTRSSERDCWP